MVTVNDLVESGLRQFTVKFTWLIVWDARQAVKLGVGRVPNFSHFYLIFLSRIACYSVATIRLVDAV